MHAIMLASTGLVPLYAQPLTFGSRNFAYITHGTEILVVRDTPPWAEFFHHNVMVIALVRAHDCRDYETMKHAKQTQYASRPDD